MQIKIKTKYTFENGNTSFNEIDEELLTDLILKHEHNVNGIYPSTMDIISIEIDGGTIES